MKTQEVIADICSMELFKQKTVQKVSVELWVVTNGA